MPNLVAVVMIAIPILILLKFFLDLNDGNGILGRRPPGGVGHG